MIPMEYRNIILDCYLASTNLSIYFICGV